MSRALKRIRNTISREVVTFPGCQASGSEPETIQSIELRSLTKGKQGHQGRKSSPFDRDTSVSLLVGQSMVLSSRNP
jgi:hypothetical protein